MNASVLILDDETKMGKALRHVLTKEGYNVESIDDPIQALERLKEREFQVLLCDLKMPGLNGLDVLEQAKATNPDLNVIMMTAFASAETAVEAMKKGAYDYLIKPFSTDELKILIARCLDTQSLRRENELLREQVQDKFKPDNVVGSSKVLESVLARARKVAASDATVLITGESGTGKEMLARVIHQASPRAKKPLITVNCGALTETLLESELFGHRRGAFTGAVENRIGLFEAADEGTIFLDEIGEISPALQVKLLRVLQSGEFQRVGEPTLVKVNVRVVAATNRNLEQMVADNTFRTDLYYRLSVVPIHIPALRDRHDDIAPLIEFFLARYGTGRSFRFTPPAIDAMLRYQWPGNVRELENAVEHAVVLSEGDELGLNELPMPIQHEAGRNPDPTGYLNLEDMTLEEAEKRMIIAAMGAENDNMTQAARRLGVTRRTLGYRLRKYGLYKKNFDDGVDEEDLAGEEAEEEMDRA